MMAMCHRHLRGGAQPVQEKKRKRDAAADGVRFMWRLWSANAGAPAAVAPLGAAQAGPDPGTADLPIVPGGCLADDMGLGKVREGR